MIRLRRIDHVCLLVDNLDEARQRWSRELGLLDRGGEGVALLSCEDEPYSLELVAGRGRATTTRPGSSPATARSTRPPRRLDAAGVDWVELEGCVHFSDPDGFGIQLMAFREHEPWVAHARPSKLVRPGAPRKLGHVNCLTAQLEESCASTATSSGCASATASAQRGSGFASAPTTT